MGSSFSVSPDQRGVVFPRAPSEHIRALRAPRVELEVVPFLSSEHLLSAISHSANSWSFISNTACGGNLRARSEPRALKIDRRFPVFFAGAATASIAGGPAALAVAAAAAPPTRSAGTARSTTPGKPRTRHGFGNHFAFDTTVPKAPQSSTQAQARGAASSKDASRRVSPTSTTPAASPRRKPGRRSAAPAGCQSFHDALSQSFMPTRTTTRRPSYGAKSSLFRVSSVLKPFNSSAAKGCVGLAWGMARGDGVARDADATTRRE